MDSKSDLHCSEPPGPRDADVRLSPEEELRDGAAANSSDHPKNNSFHDLMSEIRGLHDEICGIRDLMKTSEAQAESRFLDLVKRIERGETVQVRSDPVPIDGSRLNVEESLHEIESRSSAPGGLSTQTSSVELQTQLVVLWNQIDWWHHSLSEVKTTQGWLNFVTAAEQCGKVYREFTANYALLVITNSEVGFLFPVLAIGIIYYDEQLFKLPDAETRSGKELVEPATVQPIGMTWPEALRRVSGDQNLITDVILAVRQGRIQ